jgi:hypothetical protein
MEAPKPPNDEDVDEKCGFELPEKLLRYCANPLLSLSDHRGRSRTVSTAENAEWVKIVWGGSAPHITSSETARLSQCVLYIELIFRSGQHALDARHLRSLMHPFAHCITDMEAGNRGGTFVAIYSDNKLQAVKAVSLMMSRVRSGESPYFEDCFCAYSASKPGALLAESPRDSDLAEEVLDGGDGCAATDPMAWFNKNAKCSTNDSVNLHAPGALTEFILKQQKKSATLIDLSGKTVHHPTVMALTMFFSWLTKMLSQALIVPER